MNHTTRSSLDELVRRGELQPDQLAAAASAAQLYPTVNRWHRFLNQLMLWLGALALGFALLFFIAYNWSAMERLGRFVLVEAALAASLFIYVWKSGTVAQAALVVSALFVGVLLALFGQVYQTGADPWQLFFTWALMLLPWAVLGRTAVLWLMIVCLINVALVLYHQTFRGFFIFHGTQPLFWALLLVNGFALVAWECLAPRLEWLNRPWMQYLLGLATVASLTLVALVAISINEMEATASTLIAYLLLMAAGYWLYRVQRPNLFISAAGCMSAIVVIVYFVGYQSLRHLDGMFLVLALLTLGLCTMATAWLKRLHREMHHHD